MRGYIDLHCHPIPGIDDGAKGAADGAALLAALYGIGFDRVVATPHIRSGVWDNRRETIAPALAALESELAGYRARGVGLPALDVAAEHMFDDVTWELFARGEAMPYPGGRAALVELPYETVPVRIELRFWRLAKTGITPVLAHPERCTPLQGSSDRLEEIIGAGARPLLDVMSLVGAYGRRVQTTAERMLDAGLYFAACSDAHKASDAETVAAALGLLQRSVGDDGVRRLLIEGPRELLGGKDAERDGPR
jgi:protein-tyrosine phosphatase